MTTIDNNLIYEILKSMQGTIAEIKTTQGDHTRQLLRVREDLNGVRDDINGLRGDDLRRETIQSKMDRRLERIELRLNLTDG